MDCLFAQLDDLDTSFILQYGAECTHMSTGMALRNAWVHPKDSPLAKHFRDVYGLGHPDDVSGMILAALTAKVRGQPFDDAAKADYYREYWREQGVDPLTQLVAIDDTPPRSFLTVVRDWFAGR